MANNEIYNNSYSGIELSLYANNTEITNNLIYQNGNQMNNGGIVLNRSAEIANNTILENSYYGIKCSGGDPNISSNIIKNNTSGAISNLSLSKVKYNCLPTGIYNNGTNIYNDPCFVSANDYHLKRQSSCINNGNPYFQAVNETDIDGELRCLNAPPSTLYAVDIGADEFNPCDLTGDHITDFLDFTIFANPWKKLNLTANEDLCDFYNDNTINMKDLKILCTCWLMGVDYPGIGGDGASFENTPYQCQQQEMMMMVSPAIISIPPVGTMAGIDSFEFDSSESIQIDPEPIDVNGILNWLDDMWQNDAEIRNSMTEQEYLEFRNSIEQSSE